MPLRPVFVAVVGRGPADGGDNWLKSALALACMAGTQISSPYDVFTHALQHLVHNKTASNFNERRYYYYVTLNELAVYRSNMPAEVKGSLNIQPGKTDGTGWFFWATTDIPGQLVQRRVACACRACYNNDFDRCSEKDGDMLQGTWFNEPRINVLTVSAGKMTQTYPEIARGMLPGNRTAATWPWRLRCHATATRPR